MELGGTTLHYLECVDNRMELGGTTLHYLECVDNRMELGGTTLHYLAVRQATCPTHVISLMPPLLSHMHTQYQ